MNLEGMRHFVAVAQAGSFYGAAKRLDVSAQGLNKAVSSLESELGVKLLERGRRGVQLTEEGAHFLDMAQRLTAEYGSFLDSLNRFLQENYADYLERYPLSGL